MKYKTTIIFDTEIEDKNEFYDHLSEVIDGVDCNELDIVEFEPI